MYYRKKCWLFFVFFFKFRQQVVQKSHNWDALMKRGFNEGCVVFGTEMRQNCTQLQQVFTPVPTKRFNSHHASNSEKWWLSGQTVDKINIGLLIEIHFSWNFASKQLLKWNLSLPYFTSHLRICCLPSVLGHFSHVCACPEVTHFVDISLLFLCRLVHGFVFEFPWESGFKKERVDTVKYCWGCRRTLDPSSTLHL